MKDKFKEYQKKKIKKSLNSKEKIFENMKIKASRKSLTKRKGKTSYTFVGLIEKILEYKESSEDGIENFGK